MICYPYPDERGRTLLRKTRYEKVPPATHEMPFPKPHKAFFMEGRSREDYAFVKPLTGLYVKHPDLHDYFHSLLYRLPDFLAAVRKREHGTLYWTEGERDADSITAAGGLAVSHWQGAGSATLAQGNRLRPWFGGVVVCADEDPRGAVCALARYRLLREVGIPARRLLVVRPAGSEVLKRDVTDHLQDGYALADLVPMDLHKLERWVARIPPDQLREGSEAYNDMSTWSPQVEPPQAGEGRGRSSPSPAPLSLKRSGRVAGRAHSVNPSPDNKESERS